ncbi:unnamed protein product [Rotaria magnacalcarata]|uniref:Uncharacterized protein n=1 Tax=Rotaria magnacalcarata TaxID=392030 RepID=A0A814I4C1_9BILA|nr:unnamed protein product [Rotaria magnacalcarata]CAF3934285.1 unnamed protein product [Rotaria magnacalcarata]CAF4027418.1 unnamed protein product [Rotaria magnacalcarata]CAF4349291.1 unnamed protein product [Rotaria magnacalcarata]CAF5206784.1 unnamed protein product [Rotaria magnacalcarata]
MGSEPRRMLLPIQGFEKMPLISLIPDVEQMVWIAKQNCNQPKDDLTNEESASIMLYTMDENESLLLPTRQFEVVGCLDQGNGLHIV